MLKGRKKRIALLILALTPLALLLLWLVATSSTAICSLWLPLTSRMTGVRIEASRLSPSILLSGTTLGENLRIELKDGSLIELSRASLELDFFKLLSNELSCRKAEIEGLKISLANNPTEPSGKTSGHDIAKPKPANAETGEAKPFKVSLGPFVLRDSALRIDIPDSLPNKHSGYDFSIKELSCAGFSTGTLSTLKLEAYVSGSDGRDLDLKKVPLSIDASFTPSKDFIPESLKFKLFCESPQGSCGGLDLEPFKVSLDAELERKGSSLHIDKLLLKEGYAESGKSSATVSGSFDIATSKADLDILIDADSAKLLEILGVSLLGFDIEGARLDCSAKVSLAEDSLRVAGSISIGHATLKPHGDADAQPFGPLDATLENDIELDFAKKSISLNPASITASCNGSQVARLNLENSCSVSLSDGAVSYGKEPPRLKLSITKLPLNLLEPFIKPRCISGIFSADASIEPESQLADSLMSKFSVRLDSFNMPETANGVLQGVGLAVSGSASAAKDGSIALNFHSTCFKDGVEALKSSTSATARLKSRQWSVESSLQALNFKAASLVPMPVEYASRLSSGLKELQPFDSNLKFTVSGDASKSIVKLDSASLQFRSQLKPSLAISLAEPWALDYSKPAAMAPLLKLSLDAKGWDAASILPIQGTVDSSLEVSCAFKGDASAKGSLNISAFSISSRAGARRLELSSSISLSILDGSRLKDCEISIALKPQSSPGTLSMKLSAEGDFKDRLYSLNLDCPNCDAPLASIMAKDTGTPDSVSNFFDSMPDASLSSKSSISCDLAKSTLSVKSFLLSLTKPQGWRAAASLASPFEGSWADSKPFSQTAPSRVKLDISSFPLRTLNAFLPPSSSTSFLSGSLKSSLDVSFSSLFKEMSASGSISSGALSLKIGQDIFKNLDPSIDGSVKISVSDGSYTSDRLSVFFKSADSECMAGSLKGSWTPQDSASSLDLRIERLDERFIASLPFAWAKAMKPVSLKAYGDISLSQKGKGLPLDLKASIEVPSLRTAKLSSNDGSPESISASLSADCSFAQDSMTFRRLSIDGNGGGRKLGDISVDGKTGRGLKGLSSLNVKSSYIDALAIATLLERPSGETPANASQHEAPADTAKPPPKSMMDGSEPAPLDLPWLDAKLKLDFDRVEYGDAIRISLHAPLTISNNSASSEDIRIGVNQSPVSVFKARLDFGKSGGWPFILEGSAKDVSLTPFADAFMDGKLIANLTNLELSLSGKGFSKQNLAKNLSGTFDSSFSGIQIAHNLDKGKLFKILLIPINALPSLCSAISEKGINWKSLGSGISDALDANKAVSFSTGEADFSVSEGRFKIRDFRFDGPIVSNVTVKGSIGIEQEDIDLDCSVKFIKIIFPFPVSGTMQKPSLPGILSFVVDFIKINGLKALDPRNILRGAKDNAEGTGETAEKIAEKAGKTAEEILRRALERFKDR